jgi:hypothetical protein
MGLREARSDLSIRGSMYPRATRRRSRSNATASPERNFRRVRRRSSAAERTRSPVVSGPKVRRRIGPVGVGSPCAERSSGHSLSNEYTRDRMRTSAARAVALGGLLLVMAACDPLFEAEADKMGIALGGDGTPIILVTPCEDEFVESVGLINPASVIDDDGTVTEEDYWEVEIDRPRPGVAVSVATDDTPPAGMSLTVRLRIELGPSQDLMAVYSGTRGDDRRFGSAKEFRIEDLEPGMVMTDSDSVTMEEYEEVAHGACA